MYGLGLPILFPIAAWSYFVFWCTERYQMAYTYQLPPALDDALTNNMINLLSYSPILFLLNGLWMLSNKQIFNSWLNKIPDTSTMMRTGHTIPSLFDKLQPTTPLLLIGLAFLFIILLRATIYKTLTKWGYTLTRTEIVVDEDLPNFFNAVKLSDADWMVFENKNLRDNYGFSMIQSCVEERLDDLDMVKKPIRGIAWYSILANPYYSRLFNYIEVNVPSREDLIVDGDDDEGNDCEQSDMVSVLLNVSFAPQVVVKNFTFGPGMS